jgi:hypothetical protein
MEIHPLRQDFAAEIDNLDLSHGIDAATVQSIWDAIGFCRKYF